MTRVFWTPADDAIAQEELEIGPSTEAAAARLSRRLGRTITRQALDGRARLRGWKPSTAAKYSSRQAVDREPATDPIPPPPDLTELVRPPADPFAASYVPHPPRGPQTTPHIIPVGHELGGVSTLKDAGGKVVQQWDKTRVAGSEESPEAVPPSFLLHRTSRMQRGDGSTVVQWSSYKRDEAERWEAIRQGVVDHVSEYVRPASPVIAPQLTLEDLLVAYPLGDPHIGMLAWAEEVGESFDLKIAERELAECFRQLVARSPAAERAIVTNLGDFWHAQDNNQRTPTGGNKLDVDGRVGKVARVGLRLFRTLIDTALTKHQIVQVRSIPGNHDPTSSLWLPEVMRAAYAHEPRVIVEDAFNPYQFDRFGKVLLGWAHGDGAKLEALGEIMATDVPEMWGQTVHRQWHCGHVHHLVEKEFRGCLVTTHRSLAAKDAWHHHSGYRSNRSLRAMTYHREWGLDSSVTVGVERVRAALGEAA